MQIHMHWMCLTQLFHWGKNMIALIQMYATIFVLHLSNLSVISYELVFGTDIIMHLTIEILFDEYQRMSDWYKHEKHDKVWLEWTAFFISHAGCWRSLTFLPCPSLFTSWVTTEQKTFPRMRQRELAMSSNRKPL